MTDNKMKSTKNNKKEDGKFRSKHIKHDPQAESARAVFGLKDDNYQNKIDHTGR
ncbi:CPC_1213 family protein [Sedimentibacter sp.]|uniref:CPC_1213 family protein n=1 Tax=Sedimentibacter sp. TaxID=1960295 RepID=UPI0028B02653|nr:CPC_1213 family protein [Sedimentibacter sp.]